MIKKNIKDKMIVSAHLKSNEEIKCPTCDEINHIHYGTATKRIKEKLFLDFKSSLLLKVQKYMCKSCGTVFQDSSALFPKNENISLTIFFKQTQNI